MYSNNSVYIKLSPIMYLKIVFDFVFGSFIKYEIVIHI